MAADSMNVHPVFSKKFQASKRERLETCLSGAKPDRPPVALWRHFPVDDQTAEGLAHATLDFQRMYDFDFVKVTPASSFCLKDWGVQDEWHGATEGTREYTRRIIQTPEDWTHLLVLDPYNGSLGEQLACLRILVDEVNNDTDPVPVIQTIFSPLAQAKNLAGADRLLVHLRQYPEAVHVGLKVIAESTLKFIEAMRQVGVAGIFYAVQHASYILLSEEEYDQFGRWYDLQVLEPARDFWLNMVHLHGSAVMFHKFIDYPVQIINWHDRETYPSLGEAKKLFPRVLCGGLQREKTMVLGNPVQVTAEARDSVQETQGTRFILGTGCVLPTIAPRSNILAARKSVEL
jgi:uroporphyrinogen decarboxylase